MKPKTLEQLRTDMERAETQLAQEQHKLERLENRKKYLEKGDVYLETVETAQNPEEKADRAGLTGVGGLRRSIQQEILLENV